MFVNPKAGIPAPSRRNFPAPSKEVFSSGSRIEGKSLVGEFTQLFLN